MEKKTRWKAACSPVCAVPYSTHVFPLMVFQADTSASSPMFSVRLAGGVPRSRPRPHPSTVSSSHIACPNKQTNERKNERTLNQTNNKQANEPASKQANEQTINQTHREVWRVYSSYWIYLVWRWGRTHLLRALSHFTIEHESLSRRGVVAVAPFQFSYRATSNFFGEVGFRVRVVRCGGLVDLDGVICCGRTSFLVGMSDVGGGGVFLMRIIRCGGVADLGRVVWCVRGGTVLGRIVITHRFAQQNKNKRKHGTTMLVRCMWPGGSWWVVSSRH